MWYPRSEQHSTLSSVSKPSPVSKPSLVSLWSSVSKRLPAKLSPAIQQQACYAIGIIGMKLIGFLLLPFVTSRLGIAEYARMESLMALVNGAIVITGFGLVNNLYRLSGDADSADEEKQQAARVTGSALIISLIAFSLFLLLGPVIHPWLNQFWSISPLEYLLIGFLVSAESTLAVPLAWLRIREKAGDFLKITLTRTLIYALLVLLFLQLDYGLTGLLTASCLAVTYQVIHLIRLQSADTGLKPGLAAFRQQIRYGIPFIVSGLAMYASQGLDIVLLSQFIGDTQLAAYALAIKFFLIAALLSQPFQLWWYSRRIPLLKSEDGPRKAADGAIAGAILASLFGLLIAVTAPVMTTLFFADEFQVLTDYLPWLIIAGILKQWGALLNLGCFVTERSEIQMLIELATGAFCLIAFPLVIPEYGVTGALICLTASQLIRLIAYYIASQALVYLPYRYTALIISALLCNGLIVLPDYWTTLNQSLAVQLLYAGICLLIIVLTAWFSLFRTQSGLLRKLS